MFLVDQSQAPSFRITECFGQVCAQALIMSMDSAAIELGTKPIRNVDIRYCDASLPKKSFQMHALFTKDFCLKNLHIQENVAQSRVATISIL